MTQLTRLLVKHGGSAERAEKLAPPDWVRPWTAGKIESRNSAGLLVTVAEGSDASLITVTLPAATSLDVDQFQARSTEVYAAIQAALATLVHSAPVRFWNYLPAIHEPIDTDRDRYMVFNAGRFKAMSDWLGGPDQLSERLSAASAVGHQGVELVVHCLAQARAGRALENPRQIPAIRYSRRYGPVPPCFARATVTTHPLVAGRAVLIAGTASIVGERSIHVSDLIRQIDETLANLRSLLAGAADDDEEWTLTDVRAYYPRTGDARAIEHHLRDTLGSKMNLELVRAQLCRAELLIEIEGLATLNSRGMR